MNKKIRNQSIVFQSRSLISTFLLLIGIAAISIVLALRIDHLAREQCYMVLTSSTKEACMKIENNFSTDRNSLRILSRVIALEEKLTSNEVNKLLTTYDVSSITSNIAIITEENTIIQIRGGNIQDNQIMDFETEKKLGEHISGLQTSITASNQSVMRSFVPIKKSGKVIAMLFLEMNPTAIANAWKPEIYDNSASFWVVDRNTGEFIISGLGDSVNIDTEELSEAIRNGETGFMQVEMPSEQENLFISYMPMNMENWEIIVAVGEDAVLASSNGMRKSLRIFLLVGGILLILYLIWIIWNTRRSIAATEKQANMDILTGLQNRNQYEAFCRTISTKNRGFSCIYVDVNGLHEINNTKGHHAGDEMLSYIADTLKSIFGEDTAYRIGGDEFVIFQKKKTEQELQTDIEKVHEEIQRNDYHISAGICMFNAELPVEEMIKTAEKRMYEAKRKYYESIGKQVRNIIEE